MRRSQGNKRQGAKTRRRKDLFAPLRLGVFAFLLGVFATACDEGAPEAPSTPEAPLPFAAFELSGKILGPASSDDDADMEITLRETRGVSADINFFRVTCSNRAAQEWGASSFVDERGTNHLEGGSTVVFVRHYRCPSSGRPAEILFDLTDASGNHMRVTASPFHPDWPGA